MGDPVKLIQTAKETLTKYSPVAHIGDQGYGRWAVFAGTHHLRSDTVDDRMELFVAVSSLWHMLETVTKTLEEAHDRLDEVQQRDRAD